MSFLLIYLSIKKVYTCVWTIRKYYLPIAKHTYANYCCQSTKRTCCTSQGLAVGVLSISIYPILQINIFKAISFRTNHSAKVFIS